MKHVLLALLTAVAFAYPAFADERTVSLSVPGMFCASCPFVVQAAIGEVEGVLSVTTDAEQRTALVVFDDAITDVDAIRAASANAGYEAIVNDADS